MRPRQITSDFPPLMWYNSQQRTESFREKKKKTTTQHTFIMGEEWITFKYMLKSYYHAPAMGEVILINPE